MSSSAGRIWLKNEGKGAGERLWKNKFWLWLDAYGFNLVEGLLDGLDRQTPLSWNLQLNLACNEAVVASSFSKWRIEQGGTSVATLQMLGLHFKFY